ncbi:3-hydroxyacyl-CoA dehydrogenase family protein, partial [Eubacteriales bacterium DFI.9.88]|nr:3-hydroxyacyl-CoA dehydrogenase family protein [Eubacteriales bacterium DFI.9.88]
GMKKVPVILNQEINGFIGNRLQYAVVREAMNLVAKGICSVEDVDKVAVYGLGIRWAFLGPWPIGELYGGPGGIYDYFDHYRPAWKMAFEDLADFKDLQ